MNTPQPLQHDALHVPAVQHGFFTRNGGVSLGIYDSLNIGLTSGDDQKNVLRNRQIVAQHFELSSDQFLLCHQVHSNHAVYVTSPWSLENQPEADAMVTDQPNLILGIQTADCCPILLSSNDGKIIGAVHAGWKGALQGIIQNTVELMRQKGADAITAVIGPSISQDSYEVDHKFKDQFLSHKDLFMPSKNPDHFMFDLKAYCARILQDQKITTHIMPNDTYQESDVFFSCRRAFHQGESDFGRQISCIMRRNSRK